MVREGKPAGVGEALSGSFGFLLVLLVFAASLLLLVFGSGSVCACWLVLPVMSLLVFLSGVLTLPVLFSLSLSVLLSGVLTLPALSIVSLLVLLLAVLFVLCETRDISRTSEHMQLPILAPSQSPTFS